MSVAREQQKEEAIARMQEFGIYGPVIAAFQRDDIVQISVPPVGACYNLDDEQIKRLKKVEDRFNCVVYHVVGTQTSYGVMEAYLYVSDDEEEWPEDRISMKGGIVSAWVENIDYPDMSEAGDIGIEITPAGGLRRNL